MRTKDKKNRQAGLILKVRWEKYLSRTTGMLVLFTGLLLTFTGIKAQNEPVKLLSRLIGVRSIAGNEGEVGRMLVSYCEEKGLYVNVFSDLDSAYNFSASLYPLSSGKPNIVFTSHLDIVPEGERSKWDYDPYCGNVIDGNVCGRGAIDCKGLAVMQIMGILNYADSAKTKDYPYNITFLGVSGEETNSANGAEYVIKHHLDELNPAVVFGEGGSGMTGLVSSAPDEQVFGISVAEKSSLWLKLEVENRSHGHGAAPPSLYANKKLVKSLIRLIDLKKPHVFDDITKEMFRTLGDLNGGFRGFVIRHMHWGLVWPFVKKNFREGEPFHMLVHNTYVITKIYNPDVSSNQIAGKAYAILDCRLLPGTNREKFIKKVQNVVGNRVDVSVVGSSPQAEPTPPDQFFAAMSDALKTIYPKSRTVPILFPASTDNNYFRNAGIPTFGIIPMIMDDDLLGCVHNVNERMPVKSLKQGIDVFSKFIGLINTDYSRRTSTRIR